ncbi:substrate-binding domain-containing protein [Marivita sp. S0852]|uniref:substrate-binding domain-containing protein n=1 Tax=Marivita sp. S0852 TaxID=3373893 RepID=UPI003981D076
MQEPAFPDHEYLTVKELAALLRLKERKIYDLAATGAVPCSKATGKLLFPADEIRNWIEQAKSGGPPDAGAKPVARPPIVLGSHDPLLDWAIRQSRCGLASYYDGSLDGLERFARSEGMAAGLHIHDAKSDLWNVPAVSDQAANQNAVLISFATRRRGLVYRAGTDGPTDLADLAGRRIVPRQPESGTDTLFRELAAKDGLDLQSLDFADVARTEDEAVETVRRGDADAAFGLEAEALGYGLEFLPIIEEQFALLVDRKAWFDPPFQTLLTFCTSAVFTARAQAYGGYDTTEFGTVIWNA